MKFVTKLSVFLAVLTLAAGCATQRGMDSTTSVPANADGKETTLPDSEGSTESETLATKNEQTQEESSVKDAPLLKQKVGVLITAKNFPTHTHIGTTKFNNFTKEYSYNWQLSDKLFSTFKSAIEQNSRFEAVDISSMVKATDSLDFVKGKDGNWTFNTNQEALRKSLIDNGIATIIVVTEAPTVAMTECGTYGCLDHKSKGFGLFTRSFMGTDHYIASASFDINIESLKEPVEISALPVFKEFQDDELKNARIEDFTPPDSFDEVSEQELLPIKNTIVSYFERLATTLATYLSRQ